MEAGTLEKAIAIGIDTKIEVIVVSPTTWEAHHSSGCGELPRSLVKSRGLWWASQVVGDTTMTEIEVSISLLSWCLKAY